MNKKLSPKQMQVIAWAVSASVAMIAIVAWGDSYDWQLSGMGIYQLFPLFGLLAFSVMWSHYIASALRQHFKLDKTVLRDYFEITAAVVLTAIVLHPGLLAWQLWRDGLGLPPGSAKAYVGAASYWAIWLAIIALTIFLSYELRRIWGRKSWWRFVQYASDVAMFLIFIHALELGGALRLGWFRGVWFFYGATLAGALIYTHTLKLRRS